MFYARRFHTISANQLFLVQPVAFWKSAWFILCSKIESEEINIKNILDIFGKLNSDKRYTAGEDTGNEYIIELAKNLEVKRKQSSNKAENKSEEKHINGILQVLTKLNKESSSGGTEYLLEFSNVGVQTGKGNLAKMNTINNKKLELNKKQDLNRKPELNKKPYLNKNPELNKKQ